MFTTNKIDSIEDYNKLIKKFVRLRIKKSKSLKLFKLRKSKNKKLSKF